MNDVLMALRKKGTFSLEHIESAYFETDGSISILKKTDNREVTCRDLNLTPHPESVPCICIMDGHILEKNLSDIGKSRTWMLQLLSENQIRLKDVLLGQINGSGETTFILK